MKYFRSSIIVSVLGVLLGGFVGYYYASMGAVDAIGSGTGTGVQAVGFWTPILKAMMTVSILAILEVSLSFDNAVVNATVLKQMTPLWQKRFLTWGMVVAVFGMRIVFPLLTVAVLAHVSPWQALEMALFKPANYAQIMLSAHHEVAAYGGSFLMLVALKYFFDDNDEIHWIRVIEQPLLKLGKLEAAEVGVVLLILWALSHQLPIEEGIGVMGAGIAGVITFICIDALNTYLKGPSSASTATAAASLGMFLYLEVLDSSFSFDGVIGAFAVTNNLLIIAIGLGIGAMFVRSLTVMLVEKGALDNFVFLEHGAFYAIGALAIIMFINVVSQVPDWITGLIGAVFIGLSLISSVRHRRC